MYATEFATGNGSQTAFTFAFPYLASAHVKVKVNGTSVTAYSISGNIVTFTTAPVNNARIVIYRVTDLSVISTFERLGNPSSGGFNQIFKKLQYIVQEAADSAAMSISLGSDATWTALGYPIQDVADGTAATDAATVGQLTTGLATKQPLASGLTTLAGTTLGAFGLNWLGLGTAAAGRTSLGLGTAATHDHEDYLQSANNLGDLTTPSAARTNLGLGSLATLTPSGTPSASTYLSGTGAWAVPAGGGTITGVTVSGLATGGGTTGSVNVAVTSATNPETEVGTDTTKALTPSNLGAFVGQGTTTTSAATLVLPQSGSYIEITGSATVTKFDRAGVRNGRRVELRFGAGITLTNNANIILPGGANIVTTANDFGIFVCENFTTGNNIWRCLSYVRGDGSALVGGNLGYIQVEDQKPNGTNGGSSTTGWQTRDLNTVVFNSITGASLASNHITLPAGTYEVVRGWVPFRSDAGNMARARLQNITDSTTTLIGEVYPSGGSAISYGLVTCISGVFTITDTKQFELHGYASAAKTTTGLGVASGSGAVEVYSGILIRKVA